MGHWLMIRHLTLALLLTLAGCATTLPTDGPQERTVVVERTVTVPATPPTPEVRTVTVIQPTPTPRVRTVTVIHNRTVTVPVTVERTVIVERTVERPPEPTRMTTPTPRPTATPHPEPVKEQLSLQDKTGSADRANDPERNVTEVRARVHNFHTYAVDVHLRAVFYADHNGTDVEVGEVRETLTVPAEDGLGTTLVYDGEAAGYVSDYYVRIDGVEVA